MTTGSETVDEAREADAGSPAGNTVEAGVETASVNDSRREHIERLIERFETLTPALQEMTRVLPRAVSVSAQGGGLTEAIAPAVEGAIARSSKRDPHGLAVALAPAFGMALRRSFFESIGRWVGKLNHFLLRYASVRGLRWRIEAHRAGKTFQQVADSHIGGGVVKQVFLIHRETGILLQHLQSEQDSSRDWDLVSSMLTALQDFVHDSFGLGQEEGLETIRLGKWTVLIEQGRKAALAGVAQDPVSDELPALFQDVLTRIHREFGDALDTFDGDTAFFEKSRPYLASCLRTLVGRGTARILPQTWLVLLVPLVALGLWIGVGVRQRARWHGYLSRLSMEPGIVVIEQGHRPGGFRIRGLRDPMAKDPFSLLSEFSLNPLSVDGQWQLYHGLSSQLLLDRVRRLLEPPDTVSLEMSEGTLVVRGVASVEWIKKTGPRLRAFPGVAKYDVSQLFATDSESDRRWQRYLDRLADEPGIVVLDARRQNGSYVITGLRDPLAADPAALLAQQAIPPERVKSRWEPYQTLHPNLALARARQVLQPPGSVTLSFHEGTLKAEGEAPHDWIERASTLARSLAGITEFQTDRLRNQDRRELEVVKATVESTFFRFLVGSPDLWPGQGPRMEAFMDDVRKLQRTAARCDTDFTIEVIGHTDPTAKPEQDKAVSELLAQRFFESLQRRGMDMRLFTHRGAGTAPPAARNLPSGDANRRLVSFRVALVQE